MTFVFLFLSTLMLIAALAFVLVPLLRGSVVSDPRYDVPRKLKALDAALADGILSEAEHADKRAALLDVAPAIATPHPSRPRGTRYAAIVIALLLSTAAMLLYRSVGTPQALDPANLIARADGASDANAVGMDAAIAQLAEKMKREPDNAEGWALLGRAYQSTQRFAAARDALKHAHDLLPDDADITIEYAESLILAAPDHRIQGESLALIDQALKGDPKNQKALWLHGIAHAQSGKYDAAIGDWNTLLPLLNPDSHVAASVREQIARAEAMRGGKPLPENVSAQPIATTPPPARAQASAAESPASTPAHGAHLLVHLALDPKLKDKTTAGDTVFVFAKAANGPPMPLAIARLTVAQLPTNVTLTDAMSMTPGMTLSTFPQVVVGARISKSGQALAQSGDLQALSAPIASTRSEPVELTIDQIVP
ncbi:MAG: c-type cytochrome biogenesis protein CcmI [Proteobacteria bacterium]|nr:c-type cytochrome biogenesis protein CcmI [Pseudomonadota bacterium]